LGLSLTLGTHTPCARSWLCFMPTTVLYVSTDLTELGFLAKLADMEEERRPSLPSAPPVACPSPLVDLFRSAMLAPDLRCCVAYDLRELSASESSLRSLREVLDMPDTKLAKLLPSSSSSSSSILPCALRFSLSQAQGKLSPARQTEYLRLHAPADLGRPTARRRKTNILQP